MNTGMSVGERIRALRTERGLSLGELARQAQSSKAHLSQIENGLVANPSAQLLYRIASALGTTVAGLLGQPAAEHGPDVAISEVLQQFARQAGLSDDEVEMLARIRYRGRQPQTLEDWQYLYESIKRSVPDG